MTAGHQPEILAEAIVLAESCLMILGPEKETPKASLGCASPSHTTEARTPLRVSKGTWTPNYSAGLREEPGSPPSGSQERFESNRVPLSEGDHLIRRISNRTYFSHRELS